MPAAVVVARGAPGLVLKSVAGAVGIIYREPLLVAARGRSKVRVGVAAVERAPDVVKKCLQKTEIEKTPRVITGQHRVAAKNVVLENAGERPGRTAVTGVRVAGLPEVGRDAVELPPTDRHSVMVGRVHADRWLVRGVAGDIQAARTDVYLVTRKQIKLRDHSRRKPCYPKRGGRVVVFFEFLGRERLVSLVLARSERSGNAKTNKNSESG